MNGKISLVGRGQKREPGNSQRHPAPCHVHQGVCAPSEPHTQQPGVPRPPQQRAGKGKEPGTLHVLHIPGGCGSHPTRDFSLRIQVPKERGREQHHGAETQFNLEHKGTMRTSEWRKSSEVSRHDAVVFSTQYVVSAQPRVDSA